MQPDSNPPPALAESFVSTHTPGPWHAEAAGGRIVAANGDVIAPWVLRDSAGGPLAPEREANARLIAAAPDLLVALEAITTGFNIMLANRLPAEEIVAKMDALIDEHAAIVTAAKVAS